MIRIGSVTALFRSKQRARGIALAVFAFHCPAAGAQTLKAAIGQALRTNPSLATDVARARAAEAQTTIARANGRPSLSMDATTSYNFQPLALEFSTPKRNASADVAFSVPLYQGGAIKHSIRSARWTLDSARDQIKSGQSALIVNVAGAYVQVIAARQNLDISREYVAELKLGLLATRKRFEAGELTKADIAQSQTSLDNARVNYESAVSSLQAAIQQYTYYVGSPPDVLFNPPALTGLPSSVEEAWTAAVANNMDLAAAESAAHAARENTATAVAARLPKVRAFTVGSYVNYLDSSENAFFGTSGEQIYKTAQVGLQFSIPIYQGGAVRGQIQNARALETEAQEQLRDSSNALKREIASTYAQWSALKNELAISDEQIQYATDAVYGVKRLNALGSRTVQDVLNAEQVLLSAKNQEIQVRTQLYITQLNILSDIGSLSPTSFVDLSDTKLWKPHAN